MCLSLDLSYTTKLNLNLNPLSKAKEVLLKIKHAINNQLTSSIWNNLKKLVIDEISSLSHVHCTLLLFYQL